MASDRLRILRIDSFLCSRYRPPIHPMAASPYWVGAIVPSQGRAGRGSKAHFGSWSLSCLWRRRWRSRSGGKAVDGVGVWAGYVVVN